MSLRFVASMIPNGGSKPSKTVRKCHVFWDPHPQCHPSDFCCKKHQKTTPETRRGGSLSREAGVVGAVEIPFAGPSVCTALVLVGESQRSKRAAEKLGDATRAWCPPKLCLLVNKKNMNTTGWWFGTFFIYPYIGNNHPN